LRNCQEQALFDCTRLWLTLYHEHSVLDYHLIQYFDTLIRTTRSVISASAKIITVDLKRDYTGGFICDNKKGDLIDFMKALDVGAKNFKKHLPSLAQTKIPLKVVAHKKQLLSCIKVDLVEQAGRRDYKMSEVLCTYKRYFKQYELMAKDSIMKKLGTRISRLIGTSTWPGSREDRHFFDVLDTTYDSGLSRDEISLRDASGLIEFDGDMTAC